MTWNGTTITGPVLIYLDEILVNHYTTAEIGDVSRRGALVCRSEGRGRVSWHFTDSIIVSDAPRSDSRAFLQSRTREGVTPSVSRLSLSRRVMSNRTQVNGVWHCRLNATAPGMPTYYYTRYAEEINVAIFSRGEGK